MIEIIFSESGAGALKSAQHADGKGAVIGVIITHKDGSNPSSEEIEAAQKQTEENYCKEWEKAVAIGGSPDDVFCFDLAWDMGDISETGVGDKRLDVLNALYSIYDDDTQKGAKMQFDKAKEDLSQVMKRAQNGEDIRVWYSDNPSERCGMLWFMAELRKIKDYSGRVYTIKLPKYMYDEQENTITEYFGWGEMEPAKWHRCLEYTQDKTKECWGYAQQWWNLVRENSTLRAVVNGRVRSVSEDIYDRYIWEEIDLVEDEFIQAAVIGSVLGKHQLGIGDAFVALRMEKFIESDILQVVPKTSRGPAMYHRKLRKTFDVQE
ncbi:MAG: DUF1835 domain-containing protein [Ruminococcaceae bacterium]|nr:DUF1835 domain-containing protein [Oscillospiraceae bacterium]